MEKTVVFVDDDEISRLVIERVFKRRGVPVIVSSSGQDALQRVRELDAKYGVNLEVMLVTDGHLGEMAGNELVSRVRDSIGARLKSAVLLTGDPDSFSPHAEQVGYQLIKKSFENTQLLSSVDRFLANVTRVALR